MGSLPVVILWALLVRHELYNCKPYKLSMLAESLSVLAALALVTGPLLLVLVVVAVRENCLFLSPMLSLAIGTALLVAGFFCVVTKALAGDQAVRVSGDFGLADLHTSFLYFLGHDVLATLGLAGVSSAAIWWWQRSSHSGSSS